MGVGTAGMAAVSVGGVVGIIVGGEVGMSVGVDIGIKLGMEVWVAPAVPVGSKALTACLCRILNKIRNPMLTSAIINKIIAIHSPRHFMAPTFPFFE